MPKKFYIFKSFEIRSALAVILLSLIYIFFTEIYPIDWLISIGQYKYHSEFIYNKKKNQHFIATEQAKNLDLEKISNNPSVLFNNVVFDLPTDHPYDKNVIVKINEKKYVVKSYLTPTFWIWINRIPLRSSQAKRAWHFGNVLKNKNIPAANPVLLLEKKIGFFWTDTYLVHDYIEGVTADTFFNQMQQDPLTIEFAITNIRDQLLNLFEAGIIHEDLTLENIIMKEGVPHFIDLDRVHAYRFKHPFFKKRFSEQHYKKLSRFLQQIHPEFEPYYESIVFNLQ